MNVGLADSAGERFSLQYLLALLSPSSLRSEGKFSSTDLNAVVDWLRRARGSGNYDCYRKA